MNENILANYKEVYTKHANIVKKLDKNKYMLLIH